MPTIFKPFSRSGILYGHHFETDAVFGFYGNKFATLEWIKGCFPKYSFFELKQVHGVAVITAPSSNATADGSVTSQKNLALIIQTADCLPILIWNKKGTVVSAVHAGWRGVQKQIVKNALLQFKEPVHICIGPHIQKPSFEIDRDVATLLEQCSNSGDKFIEFDSVKSKYYADLTKIVEDQVQATGVDVLSFSILDIDTVKVPQYASFRRDKTYGRQFSFIVIK